MLGNDIIDSRSVEKRIDELRDQFDNTPFANTDHDSDKLREILAETPEVWLEPYDRDEIEELINLIELKEQGENSTSDWLFGATLIEDSHFTDYAKQYAEDTGAVSRDMKWPHNCIDWKEAADELQSDYTSMQVDGWTYWVQS